jgi:hypothetical protein
MPPKKNKIINQGAVADDFDDMLAEFRATDLANVPSNPVAQTAAEATPANAARAQAPVETVPEVTILAAIRNGDLTRLRRWHRQGVAWSARQLIMAAHFGNIAVMRCLVEELYADVNMADLFGFTPLSVASSKGCLDLIRYLIETLGADVNQAIDSGATCLMIAAEKGHVAVVQYLGKEHGTDISKADHEGATALSLAAQNGHLDVVKCLVGELGADINLAAQDGRTALMVASVNKHDKVIRWLLRHGANIQASTIGGTAVDASRDGGAPIALIDYLEAKAHCSNPGCSGAGLKKCTGCKQARYCGQACQQAHWKAHKADCKVQKKE